jgi:hypothetical protein
MHSNKVHRIIFYGTKRQRRTHFRAQACGFWVLFSACVLIVIIYLQIVRLKKKKLFDCNRAQSD